MKRTNSTMDFTKGSVFAVALLAAGVGFTLPAQATDGDKVSISVAAFEQDNYFATGQERSTRTSPESTSGNVASKNQAPRGAFANEPEWRRRVFESN